jgi:hypothetical protein
MNTIAAVDTAAVTTATAIPVLDDPYDVTLFMILDDILVGSSCGRYVSQCISSSSECDCQSLDNSMECLLFNVCILYVYSIYNRYLFFCDLCVPRF